MPRYIVKEYKSIINRMKFIDSWFWCRYTLNPYQGCEHDCIYCDARSHKYYLHPDFEETIYVKKNAALMLDMRISRARTLLPDVVATGGVCDCYQPAEKEFENTRQILKVLAKHRWPVHIGTKSPLVLRDLDIISKIARRSWAAVSFTITTTNEDVGRFLEPKVVPAEERFRAIAEIKEKDKNILTGLTFMPIAPFLEDDEENIEAVVRGAKEAGADYVLFSPGMTMRDNQALWFMKKLSESYSELVPDYEDIYQFSYSKAEYKGSYGPKKSYMKQVGKRVLKVLDRYKMPSRIKRFIPDDYRKLNYIIAEELLNEAYKLQMASKAWTKTHWAGMNIQNLKESIARVAERGELKHIRNVNDELEGVIRRTIDLSGWKEKLPL